MSFFIFQAFLSITQIGISAMANETTSFDTPVHFTWLSILAALATIGLKMAAYFLTGSVGLLSDALESLVNLVAAILALVMLTIAARPPDESHMYGHEKAEYFSSGIEGAFILIAAISIMVTAVPRLYAPQPVENTGLGLAATVLASVLNFVVARVLLRAGRRHDSVALEADAHHLMTDVWTSAGVIVGVVAVTLTGWNRLDPLIALAVAVNIIWSGWQLLLRSAHGLLDPAISDEERRAVQRILSQYREDGVHYHALRSRRSVRRKFVSVHVLVPGTWTVQRGHKLLERIEEEIRHEIDHVSVFTHLEPVEDPASWEDIQLDRDMESGMSLDT